MITTKGQRAAIKPSNTTDGPVFDSTVNIEPVKVELITEIKESATKKILGAILLFPGVVKNEATGKVEDRKHWISFDHLAAFAPADLFNKFYDNATNTFLGLAKVGVKGGRVYLANA